ncbi:MAG: imidazole glycerol phosphate synthase subunit HisH [Pseudomonadota bacterium]
MAQTVAIIDYGSGNLRSAAKAFERAARDASIDASVQVTSSPADVSTADRVVLPGVGAFADCKTGVAAIPGMEDALIEFAREAQRPFLGICVGMQLLATRGLEHGETPGFDWIHGDVIRIEPNDPALKIPHMGWNELAFEGGHPVTDNVRRSTSAEPHAYFVHSYAFRPTDRACVLASVDYGGEIVAVIGKDNLLATQFHPEKSQRTGLALIAGFLEWRP